jgi:GntR family transcriptional regulator
MNTLEPIARSKPVSEQVQELLCKRIQQGQYSPDERMPSEERLARELNVSRATVRTALAALAAEGLVRRRHGDGTYPTSNPIEITVRAYDSWSIVHQIEASGRTPSIEVLEQGLRSPTPVESDGLALETGEQVFAIRRLFLADGIPIWFAVHILRSQGLPPEAFPEAAPLPFLEFLSRYYQGSLRPGAVHFKAALAEAEIAGVLRVEPGSPLLLMEASLRDHLDRPLVLACEYCRGEEGFILPVAPFHL